jgi:AraC-like DNA-binding protein
MAHRNFFTTAGLAPRHAYEAWSCRGWPSLAPVFDTKPPEGDFVANSETFGFPDLAITRSHITGLEFARSGHRIRADEIDHLGVLILFDGSQAGDAEGRSINCGGGVVLGDLSRRSQWVSTTSRTMTLAMSRKIAEEILPPVRSLHGLVLSPARARPLTDLVRTLAPHLLNFPLTSGPSLMRAFLHMLAAVIQHPVVAEVEGDTRTVLRLAARRRAETLIEQHLHDPAFGAQELARLLGLSRSALYRLFEPDEGVADFIRKRRLQRMCAALADPADHRRIAEKGYASGFPDPVQLVRAFRRAYGMTPAEYRAIMLDAGTRTSRERD